LVLALITIHRFCRSRFLVKSRKVTAQPKVVRLVPEAGDLEAGLELHCPPEVTPTHHSTEDPEVERPKPMKKQLSFASAVESVDGSTLCMHLHRMQTPGVQSPKEMQEGGSPSSKWLDGARPYEHFMLRSKSEEPFQRTSTEVSVDSLTGAELHRMQTPGVQSSNQSSNQMQRGITPSSQWLMQQTELGQYLHFLMGTESDNETCDGDEDDDDEISPNSDFPKVEKSVTVTIAAERAAADKKAAEDQAALEKNAQEEAEDRAEEESKRKAKEEAEKKAAEANVAEKKKAAEEKAVAKGKVAADKVAQSPGGKDVAAKHLRATPQAAKGVVAARLQAIEANIKEQRSKKSEFLQAI